MILPFAECLCRQPHSVVSCPLAGVHDELWVNLDRSGMRPMSSPSGAAEHVVGGQYSFS